MIGTADKAVVLWKDYLKLKDNEITIADTESAAIAYICKLNKVGCIIVKGISDFPHPEDNEDTFNEQIDIFENNVPIIMNNILKNYLDKLI